MDNLIVKYPELRDITEAVIKLSKVTKGQSESMLLFVYFKQRYDHEVPGMLQNEKDICSEWFFKLMEGK